MPNAHSYSRLHRTSQAMNRLLIILPLCFPTAYCDSEEEVPELLRNITCLNSKLVVEEMSHRTDIKILSDTEEILFDVNSDNTDASEMLNFIGRITTVLFPENDNWPAENNTDYYIGHNQVDGGLEVKLWTKAGSALVKKVLPQVAGIQLGRITCARILHFDLVIAPEWDINRYDGYNMTSLIWSCFFGLTDLAKRLVERGADVNQKGSFSITPLDGAIRSNRDGLVELLIGKGARVDVPGSDNNLTPLQLAADKGRLNAARMLLEHGAPIDATENIRSTTPLLFAAYKGHLDLVDLLLKKGANISAADSEGLTALHFAVMRGAEDLIDRIIEAGADVNAKDSDGESPLILAVSMYNENNTSVDVVQHLLNHYNPDVNVRNNESQTALSIAVGQGYSKVQELLKSKGAIQ